jgi:deazaflavin-dependent oxidoreductase (nitroreductase family)
MRDPLTDVNGLGDDMSSGSRERERTPKLPPRWFIRSAWVVHRAIYRFTGGRRGLATPTPGGQFGYLRLKTVGRRSGQERAAILGYYEDGPNLVTLAMNGWADAEPAWWLNLQAHPDAIVELKNGSRAVRARAAEGEERARLWAWCAITAATAPMSTHTPLCGRPRQRSSSWRQGQTAGPDGWRTRSRRGVVTSHTRAGL